MMDHAASASYAAKGLSPEAVERSRKKHGTNELTRHKRITFFQQFLSNFGDPIIKILLAALVLNVLFLFRDANWFETLGIALAIFLATFVSTLSEYAGSSRSLWPMWWWAIWCCWAPGSGCPQTAFWCGAGCLWTKRP
mgnify:CR=1 FL=1